MPFERYLRADDHAIDNTGDLSYYYQDRRQAYDDADCRFTRGQHSHSQEAAHYDHRYNSHGVQFQIPQFMLNGPPILAPGGGAEVLPAGLLDSRPDSFASTWLANNGFTSFHSALISRQAASGPTFSDSANTASYQGFLPNGSQTPSPSFLPRLTASVDLQQKPFPSPSREASRTYTPDPVLSSPSAGSSNTTSYSLSNAFVPNFTSPPPITPPTLGLSVYSASGFDVLSILSRVVNRPNPTIQLGPIDLSCSFVIVDVRRHDSPIVYASPTFCHLTEYSEQEVLGRNCRFLQSPTGNVAKGEPRRFASPEAVSYMRKLLSSSKECQTTLINYRKSGQAFINLVAVIPLLGGVHNAPEEADQVAYHVGFQVDLTEQPTRILDKLRDGSYHCVNSNPWETIGMSCNAGIPSMGQNVGQLAQAQNMMNIGPKGGRHGQMMSLAVSKDLRSLIADTTFTDAVPISTGANMSGASVASGLGERGSNNTTTPLTMLATPSSNSTSMNRISTGGRIGAGSIPVALSPSLSLLLLEFLPDFFLVLSLKGAFLYVAPSVRLILGYEPQELVGRSISDVCHPADLVPLMRELKEGSGNVLGNGEVGYSTAMPSSLLPKSVDLLFRALPKVTTTSSSEKTRVTSTRPGDLYSSQSLPPSTSPSSSGTPSYNDDSDEKIPPYIWLECRGRLHVEPGKGRKAIILSGRTRWMPMVRWGSIRKAGGVGTAQCQVPDAHSGSRVMAGSIDSLEFWSLLSLQGTFLVASTTVRDVVGWGSSEVIGRSIWTMVRDSRTGVREHVESELMKPGPSELDNMDDPPPTIVTTSLVHKEMHMVPIRLVFYRTPRSPKQAASSSPNNAPLTPLIHPLSNASCPIVCQATVLSNVEGQSKTNLDTGFVTSPDDDMDVLDSHTHPSELSVFEELEATRGSSWQYELQQLKFANQRLHEELNALEGAHARSGPLVAPSRGTLPIGCAGTVSLGQPCASSSSSTAVPMSQHPSSPQSVLQCVSSMHSTMPTSRPSIRLPNSLHEQDPPSSEWSSLAGANGQGLKRSWCSENGPTT